MKLDVKFYLVCLSLFLIFGGSEPRCSYKIVLKRVYSTNRKEVDSENELNFGPDLSET